MSTKLRHLTPGNTKIGNVWSFDLPAVGTCPGATALCKAHCYALRTAHQYPAVKAKYARNLRLTRSKGFVARMVATIPHGVTFRIHVSGDFFSVEYLRDWIEIAKLRPDVKFFSYTRSWQIGEFENSLKEFQSLPNVNINLSTDKETGHIPKSLRSTFRTAYLTVDDKVSNKLARSAIVFRARHGGRPGEHEWKRKILLDKGENPDILAPLVHNIRGAPVCPKERGIDVPLTCAKCAICIHKPKR